MQDNTHQKNSKYGHFSRNVSLFVTPANGHTVLGSSWRYLHFKIFVSYMKLYYYKFWNWHRKNLCYKWKFCCSKISEKKCLCWFFLNFLLVNNLFKNRVNQLCWNVFLLKLWFVELHYHIADINLLLQVLLTKNLLLASTLLDFGL